MSDVVKNRSTPKDAAFWDHVETVAKQSREGRQQMSEQRGVPEIPNEIEGIQEALDTPKEAEREMEDLRTKYEALKLERDQYRALMELACADVIFFHSQEHGPFLQTEEPEYTETIGFSVLVNDLFCPAADAEGFDISEAIPLRDVFRKDGMEGIIRWVQQKRDNLPLRPHVEKRVKEREDLRKENATLKQQLADSELAFNHANEVVGKLEAQVARLDWQPITPENLPKVGDEVLYVDGSTASADSSDCAVAIEWGLQYWRRVTHFRPINSPSRTAPAKETEQI